MGSDLKKIISSSGINFLFRIFGLVTSFYSTLLITKLFGVGAFGNYSLAFTITQASAMIFALGIPNALIKIVGNENLNHLQAKKILIKGLQVTLMFSIVPILFFLFGAEFISIDIFGNAKLVNYLLVVTVSLPLFIFHELFLYFFLATRKFIKYSIFMFVLPNVLLITFLYLFYSQEYPKHYTFIAFALGIFIVVLVEALFIFELKPKKEVSLLTSGQLIKTASPMMFSGLMLFLLNWTDVFMIGAMMDDEQVGIYNIAFKVGSVGLLVIISINTIIVPKIAELFGKGNLAELKKLIHRSTLLIAILSLPVVLGIVFFAPFILSFFDEKAIQGTNALIIIALGMLFNAACGSVDQILNMTNNARIFRNISTGCFFLNVVLNYILIPLYGINGAAAASLITNVVLNLICIYYIKKKLGFYTFA